MSRRSTRPTRPFAPAAARIGAAAVILGAAALAGCAAAESPARDAPIVEPTWTPPAPCLSALYTDLREEGPGAAGATPPAMDEVLAEAFTRRVSLLLGREVRDPSLSPDGARVAFIVTRDEEEAGEIWIARRDGSLPYLLHPGLASARRTLWTDDGTPEGRITFSSRGRVWSFRPVRLDAEETDS